MICTKNKASAALVLSLLGAVFIYPYQEYFIGGLLLSGCLAALIGGLADWFAVTALFRKPLGISYRTSIILRNRERMLREIIDFTADDLLTSANIMEIIKRYDMTTFLLAYLEEAGGKAKVKIAAQDILQDVLANIDKVELSKDLQPLLHKAVKEIKFSAIFSEILNKSLDKKYDDAVLQFCLREVIFIVKENNTQEILAAIIDNIKVEYEKNMTRRQLLSVLMQLSPQHLAQLLQTEIVHYLEQLKDAEHPLRQQLKDWLYDEAVKLQQSGNLEKLQVFILKNINENNLLMDQLEKVFTKQQSLWLNELNKFIDEVIEELKSNHSQKIFIDDKIKAYLCVFVNEQHSLITQIIQERMAGFSDDELVAFIENRVADDLQMIRINGALVGALVGMVLHMITYLAERGWQ